MIVTPWLMLKIAGRAPLLHDDHGTPGGRLDHVYAAIARPLLRSKGASALFLIVVAALSFGSRAALYTRGAVFRPVPAVFQSGTLKVLASKRLTWRRKWPTCTQSLCCA